MGRFRGLARAVAGLGLAAGVSGCAFGDLLGSGPADDGAWLAYFSGEDLQPTCDSGETDEFRLVFWQEGRGDFQAIELIANAAGGALAVHHRVGAKELAAGKPTEGWWQGGDRQPLSPSGYAAVIYWLDRLGLFTPTPIPAQKNGSLSWVLSGCIGGAWFLNLSLPEDAEGSGVEVGDRQGQDRQGRQDRRGWWGWPQRSGSGFAGIGS